MSILSLIDEPRLIFGPGGTRTMKSMGSTFQLVTNIVCLFVGNGENKTQIFVDWMIIVVCFYGMMDNIMFAMSWMEDVLFLPFDFFYCTVCAAFGKEGSDNILMKLSGKFGVLYLGWNLCGTWLGCLLSQPSYLALEFLQESQ